MRRRWRRLARLVFLTLGVMSHHGCAGVAPTGGEKVETIERSEPLAFSVISMAKAELAKDRDYGKNGEVLLLGKKEPGGRWAEVSFNPSAEWSSINNLGEESRKLGEGGVVIDPGMVQIVAESHSHGKRSVVYVIVTGPPLPFSLATSGALTASGKTLIGGVESAGTLADGLQDSDLVEGGVVANGTDTEVAESGASASLTLDGEVRVFGDAQAAGSIRSGPSVKLEKGELKPFSEKEKLPSISIPSYDPRGREGVIERAEESVADKNPLYGFHRFSKSVTFTEEVDLNGALIYVDGDVVLDKPLKGTGALVATGKVTLRGGAAMKADSLAAVLAGDDLTIAGTAGVPSNFTGLLYTEGDLALSNTRTVGAAVGAGTDDGGSKMTIVDSEVLSSPEGQDVEIVIQSFSSQSGGGRTQTQTGEAAGSEGGAASDGGIILVPNSADLYIDGHFLTAKEDIRSFLKIRFGSVTYDSVDALPPNAPSSLRTTFERTLNDVVAQAERLEQQNVQEPVEIVRFDLNEFLNVSDRLRSSRTFYIEG